MKEFEKGPKINPKHVKRRKIHISEKKHTAEVPEGVNLAKKEEGREWPPKASMRQGHNSNTRHFLRP